MKQILSILSAFFLAIAMLVGNVFAQVAPYTLFGTSGYIESDYQEDMAIQMTSVDKDSYGGIDFTMPEGTTIKDITHLSTNFAMISGACGGGSPRFQIGVIDPFTNTEKTIYAYIGEGPTYSCDPSGWQESGNVVEDGRFVDATQLGSLFYTPYDEFLDTFGSYRVTSVILVVDSGWMFGGQSVAVDNLQVIDQTFSFKMTSN